MPPPSRRDPLPRHEAADVVVAAAHLFVDDLENPSIREADRHHVERVLRVRPGETVTVSDGHGGLRRCTFVSGGSLDPDDDISASSQPEPPIVIAFALVKGERPEWIVQKLVECGVDRIVPVIAERSVVRWDGAKAQRNVERLRAVAIAAAMQSRQCWLASIDPLVPLPEFVRGADGVVRADSQGDPPSLDSPRIIVGPEGGWSTSEVEAVPRTVRFGPSTLRAETAAIAAGVLLTAIRGGVVGSVPPRPPRL